jgi:AraC-like DNA-binding protein
MISIALPPRFVLAHDALRIVCGQTSFGNGPDTHRCGRKTPIGTISGLHVDVIEVTDLVISSWNHDDTAAPWWRLYWNDRSGWVAHYRNRRHALGPERVVLIAPDTGFSARGQRPACHFWVHFRVGPPLQGVRAQIFELDADALLLQAVNESRQALAAPEPVRAGLRVPALCALALARLDGLPSIIHRRTERVLELMTRAALEARPGRSSNRELAKQVSMSPNAFGRWFKRELGTTPHAFLMARRIEQACALLRYTDLSVEEIADRLGFCDRYHFTRTFTTLRGLSPAAFRKGGI